MKLHELLRDRRKKLGLSTRAGPLCSAYVSQIETGKRDLSGLSMKSLCKAADLYQLTPRQLFEMIIAETHHKADFFVEHQHTSTITIIQGLPDDS